MNRTHFILRINIVLGILILVGINLISTNSFFKSDLTRNNSYSLSRVSKETMSIVEDPLRVKVFYSEDVPAPYNGVRRYLSDLLREYNASSNRHFSYEFIDTSTPEGKQAAQKYGLQQVQIREVKADQFQSKSVYMGAVILYGNVVEKVDRISKTNGLEYRLTTAMRSAVTQVDALSGAEEKVSMKVLASPNLRQINIEGFAKLEETMRSIYEKVNKDNYDRINFEYLEPEKASELDRLSKEYGIEPISWQDQTGRRHEALLDVVLSYKDQVEKISLKILSGMLGGYSLEKSDKIEGSIRQGLRALVTSNPRVAYATGHGEKSLSQSRQQTQQQNAAAFASILRERFDLFQINPAEEAIPNDVDTLIINGPTEKYGKEALYRIDQFVMNGGSLFVLYDAHSQEQPTQREMMAGKKPTWKKNETGLEKLLNSWGIDVTGQVVLDEECYITQRNNQRQKIFQAPHLTGKSINGDHVVTSGLENIVFFNSTEIVPAAETEGGSSESAENGSTTNGSTTSGSTQEGYLSLLRSSKQSWTVDSPSSVSPYMQGAPSSADTSRRDLAVLLKGRFESSFDEPVELELPQEESASEKESGTVGSANAGEASSSADGSSKAGNSSETGDSPNAGNSSETGGDTDSGPAAEVQTTRFREKSVEENRIIIASTSAITTSQLLNPEQKTPNSTFLMNSIDYLNGSPGFAELRSKGLGVPRFKTPSDAFRLSARWGNTILLPLLILLIGLVVWNRRRTRSRRIREMFSENTEER